MRTESGLWKIPTGACTSVEVQPSWRRFITQEECQFRNTDNHHRAVLLIMLTYSPVYVFSKCKDPKKPMLITYSLVPDTRFLIPYVQITTEQPVLQTHLASTDGKKRLCGDLKKLYNAVLQGRTPATPATSDRRAARTLCLVSWDEDLRHEQTTSECCATTSTAQAAFPAAAVGLIHPKFQFPRELATTHPTDVGCVYDKSYQGKQNKSWSTTYFLALLPPQVKRKL